MGNTEKYRGKTGISEALLTAPSFFWLASFFVVPSVLIFAISFKISNSSGGIGDIWTLETWSGLLRTDYLAILWRTVWVSAAITAICLLLGIPVGYWIARQRPGVRYWYLLLVIVPLWTNFLIRIFAWKIVLHPDGFLRSALVYSGIISPDTFLLNNIGSVIAVSVYTYLPFAILPIYAAAEKFNFGLIEAAADLGASRFKAFASIFLPGIKRGILTAVLIVMIPSLGSYAVPDLVGGIDGEMLGNKIAQRVTANRNLPEASALAAMLTLIITLPIIFLIAGKGGKILLNARRAGGDK